MVFVFLINIVRKGNKTVALHIALQLVEFLLCNLAITYFNLGLATGYPHGSSSWLYFPLGNFRNRTQIKPLYLPATYFPTYCSP
jgi:uncharacterized membrane protein